MVIDGLNTLQKENQVLENKHWLKTAWWSGCILVSVMKILSTSLFKLSSYMQHLQKETIGAGSSIEYGEELRETEELVMLWEDKVDNLR